MKCTIAGFSGLAAASLKIAKLHGVRFASLMPNRDVMKKILLTAVAATPIASPAFAADMPLKAPPLPPAPVYGWSGFYVGAGAGFRGAQITDTVTNFTISGVPSGAFAAGACAGVSSGCVFGEPLDQVALRGTIYGGYNWQVAPQWLVGMEGDVGFASRTRTLAGMIYPVTFAPGISGFAGDSFAVKTGWDASVRGRIGWLFNPSVLLYVTGGVSWLRLEATSTCSNAGTTAADPCSVAVGGSGLVPLAITDKVTRTGGTVGGGLEAMLAPNWIVRGEYRYAGYGTVGLVDTRLATLSGMSPVGAPFTTSHALKAQTHTATFGISWLWGGAPVGPAIATDMPVKAPLLKAPPAPIYSWNGLYIGAGAGVRSTQATDTVTNFTIAGAPSGPFAAGNCGPAAAPGGCVFGEPLDQLAPRGTIYGGYNWQAAPRWLVGIEGDGGFASRTRTLAGMAYPMTSANGLGISQVAGDSFALKTGWDASVRGRVGWLWTPSVLLYVTGGVSWLRLETTSTCASAFNNLCTPGKSPGLAPAIITDKATRTGGTVGGGIEAMLVQNWIARAEYRFADYGTAGFVDTRVSTAGPAGTPWVVSHGLKAQTHTATFGISYLWDGGPVIARY